MSFKFGILSLWRFDFSFLSFFLKKFKDKENIIFYHTNFFVGLILSFFSERKKKSTLIATLIEKKSTLIAEWTVRFS